MANKFYALSREDLEASISPGTSWSTADGAADGSTIVDSSLVGQADSFTGKFILILSGICNQQIQVCSSFDNVLGVIYLLSPYSSQIKATTLYRPLNFGIQKTNKQVSKTSTSPLSSGNLFQYTGSIGIVSITGRVTTQIQAQATTTKLSVVSDALAAYDICTTLDINGFAVGSLISITGTAAQAMVGSSGVAAVAPGQLSMVVATCITSGYITVTFGAASTGAIVWELLWVPLSITGLTKPA